MLTRVLAALLCAILLSTPATVAWADDVIGDVGDIGGGGDNDDGGGDDSPGGGAPWVDPEPELDFGDDAGCWDQGQVSDGAGGCADAGGPGAQPVDAQAFALYAMSRTPIPAPEVHMSPETNLPSIVNLQTWLWITSGWQTYTATASTGLSTITVTAVPQRTVWQMGEGGTNCSDAGKPWSKGMGDAVSDCGFTYQLPHASQAVSAWVEYEATWTCSGLCSDASGTLGLVASDPWEGNVEVRERQTVVTR